MHPIICSIGPFTVYSYGLTLVAGFLLAASLARFHARRFSIDPDFIFNFAFTAFVSGIAGARIFFILAHLDFYLKDPLEMVMVQHGGLAWFGGLFGGITGAVLYARKKKTDFFAVVDFLVPFVALAQAVGRIGCYLNGCCYGRESMCGMYSPAQDAFVIPTQLYSSLALLAIFAVLRLLQERPHITGTIFYAYLALYSLKRFIMEFFRADTPPLAGPVTIFHLLSIAVFSIAAAQLIRILRRKR